MRGHFQYVRFKTFPMTPRTPQCEVFWALLSNSKHSGVPEDSQSPTLGVLGFTPTLGQSGVATVDLLVSTLGGLDCILGMEFITQNNVLVEGHNRLVGIPFRSGIVRVKAHELPRVGGSTIHFMLGKMTHSQLLEGLKCESK